MEKVVHFSLNTPNKTNLPTTTTATRSVLLGMNFYRLESEEKVDPQTYTQENVEFADASVGEMNMGPSGKGIGVDSDDGARLGNFLSRPVIIFRYDWLEGNVNINAANFQPWRLYFTDTFIRSKIANYARLRCKLHLKFVINTSPFYYGRMRVCYSPLDHDIAYNGVGDQWKFSQKPGVYLDPSESTTAEMVLPFFWPENWLDCNLNNELNEMGRISLIQYAQLRSANGVSLAAASIVVYAWAEDVELAGLTTFTLQGKDEYEETGVISGPASAVARVASKLKSAPIIGNLATATEVGANTVAGIARLFGFSNPPVISDVAPYQPKSFHAFSNVDTSMPIDKLTIDPKNEITVDPSVTGGPSEDEMNIDYVIKHPSFVQGTLWSGSQAPDALLWSTRVSPNYILETQIGTFGGQNYFVRNHTPLSYVGECFSKWRGTIVYVLKFVKTKYHAGRILVTWDPNDVTSSDETVNYTRLIDIQQHDEVEIAIPFKAPTLWRDCIANSSFTNGGGYPPTLGVAGNGTLSIRVNSVLTGPAANPSVDILVYTKAGDDFKYSVPRDIRDDLNRFQLQGAEVISGAASEDQAQEVEVCTVGEAITSLRTLVHRTTLVDVQTCGNPRTGPSSYYGPGAKGLLNYYEWIPRGSGYDLAGRDLLLNVKNSNQSYGNIQRTHFLTWLSWMYAGARGSVNHHFNVDPNGASQPSLAILNRRGRFLNLPVPRNTSTELVTTLVPGLLSDVSRNWHPNGSQGMTLTNTATQAAIAANVPFYSSYKFRPVWNFNAMDERGIFLSTMARTGTGDTTWPIVYHYISAGVDFSFNYFVGTPTIWRYSAPISSSYA
jgi:hypothetical protein